jgi:hypothetical protein
MLNQAEAQSESVDEYTKFLLRERRRHLRSLARRYAKRDITRCEYQSCRESLLQAISELINIERSSGQRDPRSVKESRPVQLTNHSRGN